MSTAVMDPPTPKSVQAGPRDKAPAKAPTAKNDKIYDGLVPGKAELTLSIVLDSKNQFSKFSLKSAEFLHKSGFDTVEHGVQKLWKSHDDFAQETPQTILAYHEMVFKADPPKGQDPELTRLYTWSKMVSIAKDCTGTVKGGGGSKLEERRYEVTEAGLDEKAGMKTPQANTCLKIVRDLVRGRASKQCTEAELKASVEKRQEELHTKQDPWRIFQYYRPSLIKEKMLRQV